MAVLLAYLLIGAAQAKESSAVAMVLRASPGATVQRDGGKEKPLRDLDLLQAGDVIRTGKEPVRLVVFEDGHGETVFSGKQVTVGKTGCTPVTAREVVARKLNQTSLAGLRRMARSDRSGSVIVRSLSPGGLVAPAPGGYVLTSRPTFRWPAVKGATSYEVRLFSNSRENSPLWKSSTRETSLAYPKEQPALLSDTVRYWDVVAVHPDGVKRVVPRNLFQVPSSGLQQRLDEVTELTKNPENQLLAATLFEAAKAYDAAFELYQKAAKQRPNQPNLLLALRRHHLRVGDRPGAATIDKQLKKLGVNPDDEVP